MKEEREKVYNRGRVSDAVGEKESDAERDREREREREQKDPSNAY